MWLRRRFGSCRLLHTRRGQSLALPLSLHHHQRPANRDHIAHFARNPRHDPRNRRFHLHGGLVGHHIGERGILLHPVAHAHMPRHDLSLGNAFANIGQVERKSRHMPYSASSLSIASPIRTGPGKYAHSRLCG